VSSIRSMALLEAVAVASHDTREIRSRFGRDGAVLVRDETVARKIDEVVEAINDVLETALAAAGMTTERHAGELLPGPVLNAFHDEHRPAFLLVWEAIRRLVPLIELTALPEVIDLVRGVGVEYPILSSYPAVRIDLASQPETRHFPPHREMIDDLGSHNAAAIWIPLQDVGPDTGTGMLHVGLGSHRDQFSEGAGEGGLKYQIDDPKYAIEQLTAVPMRKGDCLVFTFHTVHASGRFTSEDAVRGSVQLRFDDLRDPDYAARGWPQNFTVGGR
jgi:ectoine hydroxylase-related dioxygenase (phytanoyl-CoA dioxygenase family)